MLYAPNELKAERVRQGKSIVHMSNVLGIAYDSYLKKERGQVRFSDEEKVQVIEELSLSFDQLNRIFFKNKLPTGNAR